MVVFKLGKIWFSFTARSVSSELKRPHPPSIKCADCSSSRFHSPKHNHLSEKKLCCLCEYRSVRNIPLSFEEENKKEKDALLMHYQQSKDEEAMLIEEVSLHTFSCGNFLKIPKLAKKKLWSNKPNLGVWNSVFNNKVHVHVKIN